MFRRKADRIIDHAHHKIAGAEMTLAHSFTDADKRRAGQQLADAQDYLRRAVETKASWDATEHDDYEEYPDVPEAILLI